MIMNGPVPPERQARSRLNYCLFTSINGLSYMCLGEVVIILLAVQIDCKDYIVSTLGAMLYFGFLLLPFGKYCTARIGAAQGQGLFWVLRNISGLLVAAAAPVHIWIGHVPAVVLLLTGAFLFYGFRAAGNVGVQPLLGEMIEPERYSSFIALTHGLFYATCCIALAIISTILYYHKEPLVLAGIIVAGALLGITASYFVSRIDETGAIRDSAKKPIMSDLRVLAKDPAVIKMFLSFAVINLVQILLTPIYMLAVKRGYGVSNTGALIFALIQMGASVAASYGIVRATQKIGPRRVMIITYIVMIFTSALWIVAPTEYNFWFLCLIFILCGSTFISMNNSMIHYFLSIVEEERRVAATVLSALITGAGAGVAGMLISGSLLAGIEKVFGAPSIHTYKIYFILAAMLLSPGLCMLSSMKPLPIEKRKIRKSWYDFLW